MSTTSLEGQQLSGGSAAAGRKRHVGRMSDLSISAKPETNLIQPSTPVRNGSSKTRKATSSTSPSSTTTTKAKRSSRKRSHQSGRQKEESDEDQRMSTSSANGSCGRKAMIKEAKNGGHHFHFDDDDEDEDEDSYVDSYVANHAERSFCGGNLDGEEAPPLGSSSSDPEKFQTVDAVPLEARALLPVS